MSNKLGTIADTVSGWLTPKPKKPKLMAEEEDKDDEALAKKIQKSIVDSTGGK